MMREPFLEGQTMAVGEAMRAYRGFDIPGIDMLCDDRELTTAKQAQSAVHQYGYSGMTSEIYGVTNWDFDFRGHKLAGDWQAALGVTKRVHHLTWTTMEGEAKRDYPASIGYQSPWYRKYSYIENYFSRLNTVLSRGKALVKVGVIHPIESYWLYWGTREHTDEICRQMAVSYTHLPLYWKDWEKLDGLMRIVRKAAGDKPVIAKAPGGIYPMEEMARVLEGAGTDMFVPFNCVDGCAVNIWKRTLQSGGYFGPGIKPLALSRCREACSVFHIPVIGAGGITCAEDVIEYIMVGAFAVQLSLIHI